MPFGRKKKQREKMAKVRADVPHRHDYRLVGTVMRPGEEARQVWKCRSCPSRLESRD